MEELFNNIECFEDDFLKWYDSGKPVIAQKHFYKLYHQTISNYLIWEYSSEETVYGDPGRWSQTVLNVIKIKNRFFFVTYDRGLTEMQENYYGYDNEIQEAELKKEWKEVTWWDKKDN